jgi:long-chain acyl-CoA synthetase
LAPQRGWPVASADLASHAGFEAYVQDHVNVVNTKVARFESIKKFVILANDFTQETGELTPTQKVKRKVVLERYAREIEGLYAAEAAESAAG